MDKSAPPAPVRSDTQERLSLINTLLTLVDAERIETLVTDQEFTGKRWFKGLKERRFTFMMRVRNNTLIGSERSHPLS